MKKIILFLLFATTIFAQEVSPYYPAVYTGDDPAKFSSQLTYFDSNFIVNRVSDFIYYNMAMTLESSDDSKLLFNGGELTYHYVNMFSSGKGLIIKYYVGKVNDIYTIKSVKITGGTERLITFFVSFWKTSINFETPSGKSDVSLLNGQDVVKYYFNKGNPYINVTNSTYKSIEEFSKYFDTIKDKK